MCVFMCAYVCERRETKRRSVKRKSFDSFHALQILEGSLEVAQSSVDVLSATFASHLGHVIASSTLSLSLSLLLIRL